MSKKRLYQSVVKDLTRSIQLGEFPPGARLPGERELAERFGVSRVTVREAAIALEAKGLITVKTGSGAYVNTKAEIDGALPDVTAFDVTAARAVIEAEAAALAAARITPEEALELKALVAEMSRSDATEKSASDADRAFHMSIAKISGNPVIEHCVKLIWRMRDELPEVKAAYARVCHHDSDDRANEHGAILTALVSNNSSGARAAMRNHFHRLFESMLEATENDALAELKKRSQLHRDSFLAATGAVSRV